MKKFSALLVSGLFVMSSQVMAEDAPAFNPKPGQWSTMVSIFDHNSNNYSMRTAVDDDLNSCSANLQRTAEEIQKNNGKVWINRRLNALTFKKEANTEVEVQVLQVRCVLEPFKAEQIRRF